MTELEISIEGKVVNWAKKHGWIVLKLNNPWSRGWPDRLFISPEGNHIYIEFKKPGGAVRKLQLVRLRSLDDHGCTTFIVDNVKQGIHILNEFG
jgi:hypothetical protein